MTAQARRPSRPRPTRRQVLGGIAAALAASGLPACGSGPVLDERALPDAEADLDEVARAFFGADVESARIIGEVYLDAFAGPDEARADLEESFGPVSGEDDPDEVAADLESALASDFDDHRVHPLGGWILGLTELRAAAVARLAA